MFGQRRNIKCDFTAHKHNPFSFIYRDFFLGIFLNAQGKNNFLGAGGSHSSDSPFRILH